MIMNELVSMVRIVNPHRSMNNLNRRLLKILEELGETSEAYLSVSSPHNYKAKSWLDYREEAVDTLIVLIDVALTELSNSYPPQSLIPSSISLAVEHSFDDPSSLMFEQFQVAGAVSAAATHLRDNNPMGFYGAINRGIQAAANMCFARIPEDNDRTVIAERVKGLFDVKLGKWSRNMAMYQATDDGK
jgi:NTP pyrophosphatase (non-canonical NTP hydrolase)